MTEPQIAPTRLPTTPTPPTAIALTHTGALFSCEALFETVSKTILKLHDPSLLQPPPPTATASLQAVEAMQRLVELVGMLRSPEGGCPTELEPTPENLTPYVEDEAQEVLDALQVPATHHNPAATLHLLPPAPYLTVETLVPQLLWCIARTSFEGMQLIEGVRASVRLPNEDWQSGVVRLAILLELEARSIHWSFDLVTHQPLPLALEPQATLQLHWGAGEEFHTSNEIEALTTGSDGETVSATQLLQEFQQSICATSRLLNALTSGLEVDLLEPGKSWRSADLHLKLALEFVADLPETANPDGSLTDAIQPIEPGDLIEPTELAQAIPDHAASTTLEVEPTELAQTIPDNTASTTLEEFASGIAPAISQAATTPEATSLVDDTLAEFAAAVTQAMQQESFAIAPTIDDLLPERSHQSATLSLDPAETGEFTLADFALDVSQVFGEVAPKVALETSSEASIEKPVSLDSTNTLEEFAIGLAQTLASSATKPEASISLAGTLEEFAADLDPNGTSAATLPSTEAPISASTNGKSAATHLPTESVAPASANGASSTEAVTVASVEVLTADLPEAPDLVWERRMGTIVDTPPSEPSSDQLDANPLAQAAMTIRLVDPAIHHLFFQEAVRQSLVGWLLPQANLDPEQRLLRVVSQAWELTETSTSPVGTDEPLELQLGEWMPRLLWQITSTSYEVMRLIAGVEATVLQPHWGWKTGILRLLPLLRISTPDAICDIDLVTGQTLHANSLPLISGTIVRSDELPYQQPLLAEAISNTAISYLQESTSEVQLLMDGITIEMRSYQHNWQPANLQLVLSLELMVD